MLRSVPVLLACVGAALAAGCHRSGAETAGGSGGRSGAGAPVPVVAGAAEARDVPIYLDGIGTVQAFNTVTVHSQVEGVLQTVAFREGQEVKAGDVLAEIDARPYQAQYDQAKAKRDSDAAQLASAQRTYQRNASLLGRGLIDQQTVDTEKGTVDQITASVAADEAAMEQQAVQLGYTKITAPVSGRTGMRFVDQGNLVRTTDTNGLVVITQLKPISVTFTLPQQAWKRLQDLVAAGAMLPTLAIGDQSEVLDRGVLSVVDNQIDTATGTIKLKATFPNAKLALWPGQFVNVRLLVETRKGGIVVPASVIQRGPQGAYAFVIQADGTVAVRPVQVGQIDAGFALIDQGLAAGEQVVVDGQYKLQPGSKVTTGQRRRAG